MRVKTLLSVGIYFLVSSLSALGGLDLKFTGKISMLPDPAAPGDPVNFSVSFNNEGAAVDNLLCVGGVDDVRFFERTFAHIDAGKNRALAFNWAAIGGAHTVWFELDPDRSQKDGNYNNNRIEMTIKIGGEPESVEKLPDLVVPDAWVSPGNAEQGSNITFNCDIQNKGGALKGKWFAAFMIDNKEVASKEFTDFKADGYQKYDAELIAQDLGSHTMICEADSKDTVSETNESNNLFSYHFTVVPSQKSLSDFKIESASVANKTVTIGDKMQFMCTIKNIGESYSKELEVLYSVDGGEKKSFKQIGLPAGGWWNSEYIWTTNKPGFHTFTCSVDPLNKVIEASEQNNKMDATFEVLESAPLPDIKNDIIMVDPTEGSEGTNFQFHCRGINKGGAFKENWRITSYIDYQASTTTECKGAMAGESCSVLSNLKNLGSGVHEFKCVYDSLNQIQESNESNNEAIVKFTVTKSKQLPDLLAQSVSTDKKKYSEGEEVQVVCFYKNIGGSFEGNWRLMVFVGGDSEYSNSVINTSGYVPWIWKAKGPGKYNVGCSLDTQGQVTESNESNNVIKDIIEVVPLKGVILFEHDNYNGAQEIFMADDPDLRNNVIGNDKASSIKVPAGCVATLYEHINYQGKSETFRGNDNWLGDNTIGNDNVSSIQVRCNK